MIQIACSLFLCLRSSLSLKFEISVMPSQQKDSNARSQGYVDF